MGNRLTRIYTRTGDEGTTGIADGTRLAKDAARIVAIGEVDELNSLLSVILAEPMLPQDVRACLESVQHDLFDFGGSLSLPGRTLLSQGACERLERLLDDFNVTLPPLKEFILPGGGQSASFCHLARAVCRRAERALVTLSRTESVDKTLRCYLNRLSDLLFVMARLIARNAGTGEEYWRKPGQS